MSLANLAVALKAGIEPPAGRRRPRGKTRAAGVLIALTDTAQPDVILTLRASSLRSHAGQMAFPGGRVDPGDPGPVEAALREAHEEVGLDPQLVTVLGTLPTAWVPVSGFAVTPVVGSWAGRSQLRVVDSAEVMAVLRVQVADLANPDNRVTAAHPSGVTGPAFVVGDDLVWGLTGYLLDMVLHLASWEQPWDSNHIVDVPKRFMG